MQFLVLFILCAVRFLSADSKILPNHFPEPCSKSDPNYSACTFVFLKKLGPHLEKGVRELNFPSLNPLDIPQFIVNRTLNNLVSVDAVLKNIHMEGLESAKLEDFKFDTERLSGELQLSIPFIRISQQFNVTGRVLELLLNNAGIWNGNYTNIQNTYKFSLKNIDKLGVKYYTFEDFSVHSTIGDGKMEMEASNPQNQPSVDLIVNFTNSNFPVVVNAVGPIYDEVLAVFYKYLAELVLHSVPAQELIPDE